jgi:hypothetical protein
MASKAVRQAVREAFFDAPQTHRQPPARLKLHDCTGASGIATVLQRLHHETAVEPLPAEMVALLRRVDAADRRQG